MSLPSEPTTQPSRTQNLSGPHQPKNCSKKRTKSDHCCSKCYNSKVPSEKSNCKSHNAADPQCPVILREIQKIVNNTDTISKNVI